MLRGKRGGLTLTEVLIIIAAVGLVAVASLPLFNHAREQSRREMCARQLGAIHKAITMYETDYNGFPTRSSGTGGGYTSGDAQEALNLLYRAYTDDVRIFSCPSRPLSPAFLDTVLPCTAKGWPGSGGTSFTEAAPGATSGYSTSYGYSPGHNSSNSLVIIMADHQGAKPNGNSDNHGRDVGQNVLNAGGVVEFRSGANARRNSLGVDKQNGGIEVVDQDIFTYNNITPNTYVEWDSGCR